MAKGQLPPPIRLECCCCGAPTMGRQWWNRDKGFGLCADCIVFCGADVAQGEETASYGVRGVHYDVPDPAHRERQAIVAYLKETIEQATGRPWG